MAYESERASAYNDIKGAGRLVTLRRYASPASIDVVADTPRAQTSIDQDVYMMASPLQYKDGGDSFSDSSGALSKMRKFMIPSLGLDFFIQEGMEILEWEGRGPWRLASVTPIAPDGVTVIMFSGNIEI